MGKKKPRPRRSFTPAFKAEIVDLCRRGDRSVGQVAKDFDLTETAVRDWVRQTWARRLLTHASSFRTACRWPEEHPAVISVISDRNAHLNQQPGCPRGPDGHSFGATTGKTR
ncbi:transposase [Streptomyces wuyuanensis]|uniref:transposase n=1 Tax=Streptomyces wuyuanensis TaxID=1196353 RepID=UPI0034445787